MDGLSALLTVLIAAFLLLRFSIFLDRRRLGIHGEVIYSDSGKAAPLFSRKFLLAGKPDYVVKQGAALVPVEVKSSSMPRSPYPSHVMQVVSYCALVEDCFGSAPRFGIIKYRDGEFKVPYDEERRKKLLAQVREMRSMLGSDSPPAVEIRQGKCSVCGYEELCKNG